jgi:hypothetical protein
MAGRTTDSGSGAIRLSGSHGCSTFCCIGAATRVPSLDPAAGAHRIARPALGTGCTSALAILRRQMRPRRSYPRLRTMTITPAADRATVAKKGRQKTDGPSFVIGGRNAGTTLALPRMVNDSTQ